jgi:hypothetical protein
MDMKALADFVGSVGVPGAILLIAAWSGKQLVPTLVKFFEDVTQSLAEIRTTLVDIRVEMKETNSRLTPTH